MWLNFPYPVSPCGSALCALLTAYCTATLSVEEQIIALLFQAKLQWYVSNQRELLVYLIEGGQEARLQFLNSRVLRTIIRWAGSMRIGLLGQLFNMKTYTRVVALSCASSI
jgi:hypothetical protein